MFTKNHSPRVSVFVPFCSISNSRHRTRANLTQSCKEVNSWLPNGSRKSFHIPLASLAGWLTDNPSTSAVCCLNPIPQPAARLCIVSHPTHHHGSSSSPTSPCYGYYRCCHSAFGYVVVLPLSSSSESRRGLSSVA